MSDVFLDELGLPAPDVYLERRLRHATPSRPRGRSSASSRCCSSTRPALVVVPGDVNSTLAAALAAVKLGIPVAHVEAGLRSFDPTMPEEHNRRLTDHLSAILLAHSQSAVENLAAEGIARRRPPRRQHDDRLAARARRDGARGAAVGRARARAGRLRARDAAPAGARRRPGAARATRRGARRARRGTSRSSSRCTRAPRAARAPRARPTRSQRSRRRPHRAARLPRVPRPRGGGALRADRLGRRPGGDDRARRPVLHAARHDRAAGDGRARDEHAARPRARSGSREIPALLEHARARPSRSRSGTATPASARAGAIARSSPAHRACGVRPT